MASLHPKFVRLVERTQYAQRTPEWYAVRQGMLTASDAAAALGIPPYPSYRGNTRRDLIQKKLQNTFINNVYVLHGQAYEDEARDLAMAALGEVAVDVGLFVHEQHGWLGASPDGITERGILLEIKCPLSRDIVHGHVPHHYYAQIQVQLEVCDVDACYFIQYVPRHVSVTGDMVLSIVTVERDRQWFATNLPALQSFIEEWQLAQETHVITPNDPLPLCSIVDDLYLT